MRSAFVIRPRPVPDPAELVPLSERAMYLELVRICFAAVVIASAALAPTTVTSPLILATSALAYVAVAAVPQLLRRLGKHRVLPLLQAMLLLDGLYLAYVMSATGGAASPLRVLVYVHLVAVALLTSSRTALKVALWDTLLFLVLLEAGTGSPALPGLVVSTNAAGDPSPQFAVLHVAGLWMVTLAAIACSGLSERALRSQKAELERLSMMVAAFDLSRSASDIARILLEELHEAYGFPRAALLGSPDGDLALLGSLGAVGRSVLEPGLDPLMERAWIHREVVLVRRLDRESDVRLARLFPEARNVLVVPLFLAGGSRLGLLLLENPASDGIPTWTVATVRRFAFHAALALRSAWSGEGMRTDLAEASAAVR